MNWDFVEGQYAAAKGENEGWRYPVGAVADESRARSARGG